MVHINGCSQCGPHTLHLHWLGRVASIWMSNALTAAAACKVVMGCIWGSWHHDLPIIPLSLRGSDCSCSTYQPYCFYTFLPHACAISVLHLNLHASNVCIVGTALWVTKLTSAISSARLASWISLSLLSTANIHFSMWYFWMLYFVRSIMCVVYCVSDYMYSIFMLYVVCFYLLEAVRVANASFVP